MHRKAMLQKAMTVKCSEFHSHDLVLVFESFNPEPRVFCKSLNFMIFMFL